VRALEEQLRRTKSLNVDLETGLSYFRRKYAIREEADWRNRIRVSIERSRPNFGLSGFSLRSENRSYMEVSE
jgi:hypothetical protein